MKNILKYLFFFIIGLILFILLNSKDRFSIGGPAWAVPKSSTQDPNARDSWDQYNYYYSDDPLYTVEYITNTYLAPIIISDFPDRVGNDNTFTYTPNGDTPGAWNGYPIEFVHYPREPVGGGLGLPPNMVSPRPPGIGFGQGGPGGGPGGGSGGGLFSILLNRCSALAPSIGIDISESSDTDILDDLVQGQLFEIPNIREFHFSEGVSKNVLESTYRYIFGPDIMDGVGGDYRLYDVDDTDYKGLELREELGLPDTATHDECVQAEAERNDDSDSDESMCDTVRDRLKRLYTQSGNSEPSYALSKNAWGTQTLKLYYLTFMINGVEYLVARALISISGDYVELKNITTLPQGYGYGTKLMELLATLRTTTQNPDYISQINTFVPLCIIPYRNMFRKSVTDWPTIGPERFSIFNPITTDQFSEIDPLMNILYFNRSGDYDYLYHSIYRSERDTYNPINRSHFNLFLMGLDEDTITGILSNLNRQNLSSIIILYTQFLLDNHFPTLP
jgi:hypothetical protein